MNLPTRPQYPSGVDLQRITDVVTDVTLRDTLHDVDTARPADRVVVTGVGLDSRLVQAGDLYAALPGANVHGARFVGQAVAAGAVAILTDPAGRQMLREAGHRVPVLLADSPRGVLGPVAALVYDYPADALEMIGITGTNGKTTTAYLLRGALERLAVPTGLIGTIEIRIGDTRVDSERTTPEACDLHGLLALMRERGCHTACMEVSSHALALHRVDAVDYDVAIFTNLSQDHLDFHGTMADYFAAKAELFTPARTQRAVICVDDDWGRQLATRARAAGVAQVLTLATPAATDSGTAATDSDQSRFGESVESGVAGRHWVLRPGTAGPDEIDLCADDGQELHLRSPLPGAHNRTNTALAALALLALGYDASALAEAVAGDTHVPGRMQKVDLDGPDAPLAYVDFAHTPDAIEATLRALRGRHSGPLVAVLGAGGERDPGKRPLMGAAAARGADQVVVTDDNPRHEEPAAIRAAVAAGAREVDAQRVHEVGGRAAAIARGLDLAGPEGTLAVLGKGHEQGQIIGDTITPFDDAQVVSRQWSQRHASASVGEHCAGDSGRGTDENTPQGRKAVC